MIFFTYFRFYDNILSIVYSRSVADQPRPSVLDESSNSIFSKTEPQTIKRYSTFSSHLFASKLLARLVRVIRPYDSA